MSAKFFSVLLVMLAVTLTSLYGFADSGSSQSNQGSANGETVLTVKKDCSPIKRIPSNNQLVVVYVDRTLTLISDSYECEFDLRFVDRETGMSYEVFSLGVGCTCTFELPCGEYDVTAESNDRMSFYGIMTIY